MDEIAEIKQRINLLQYIQAVGIYLKIALCVIVAVVRVGTQDTFLSMTLRIVTLLLVGVVKVEA